MIRYCECRDDMKSPEPKYKVQIVWSQVKKQNGAWGNTTCTSLSGGELRSAAVFQSPLTRDSQEEVEKHLFQRGKAFTAFLCSSSSTAKIPFTSLQLRLLLGFVWPTRAVERIAGASLFGHKGSRKCLRWELIVKDDGDGGGGGWRKTLFTTSPSNLDFLFLLLLPLCLYLGTVGS